MSEYQLYEFRAIDRPLTSKEMQELRALSSRAEITPTSFTNEYSYGDFRALYLGWLAGVQYKMHAGDWDEESDGGDGGDAEAEADREGEEDGHPEPPVPAGLGALNAAHQALADFLMVDTDLLEAAAE